MENWLARFNGKTMPLSEVRLSPLDRGFLFGDAVYEVMRVYSGKIFLLEAHVARLRRSLDCLRIEGLDAAVVQKDILDLLKASGEQEATVYLQVSRGVSSLRSHCFPKVPVSPTIFMYVAPFADPLRETRRLGASAITQPDIRWGRVDIKTVNLLGNVLSLQAAKEADAVEAILVNGDGEVTEGTHTNVFAVVGGVLRTKPLSHAILPGISRDFVMGLARELGIPFEERALRREELRAADEIFVTATTMELMPIVRLDNVAVGAGVPGPATTRLQAAFAQAIESLRG